MDVVVSIGGRAALPVRAIPFLTDWEVLSPDVVAKIFAGEDARAQRLRGLQAFRLDSGAVLPMAERAWSTVSADLRELESTLAAGASAHRDWRGKATELLPTGVFVWRDEFERSYEREYGKNGMTRWNLPEEEDSRVLDFSPFVPPELQQLVMEGFDSRQGGRPDAGAPARADPAVVKADLSPTGPTSSLGDQPAPASGVTRKAIAQAFPKTGNWSGLFSREKENGLSRARLDTTLGRSPLYDPEAVAQWVTNKTGEAIGRTRRKLIGDGGKQPDTEEWRGWGDPLMKR